jgi:hypothetical protein
MAEGDIFHTIRFSNSWQPWGNVTSAVANNLGPMGYGDVACAGIGNDLHVIFATGIGMVHTIRYSNYNSWQPWGSISQTIPNTPAGHFYLACAGIGDDLHVIASRTTGPGSSGLPHVYHTIRYSDSTWQPWGDVSASVGVSSSVPNVPQIRAIACATVGDDLHLVGYSYNYGLVHTIRYSNSNTWQPWGNIRSAIANTPADFGIGDIACAGIGDDLHLVVNAYAQAWNPTTTMFHTVRFDNPRSWQPWGNVSSGVTNSPGPLITIACASVRKDLHVIGSKKPTATYPGDLLHTIRYSNSMSWQPWGNVSAAITINPLQRRCNFMPLACTGIGTQLHLVGVESYWSVL